MDTKTLIKFDIPQVPYYYKVYGTILQNVERIILCSIQVVLSCFSHSFAALQRVTMYFHELSLPKCRVTACQIMQNMKDLKKSPKHMIVIINEDDVVLQDVANLLIWGMFSGIPLITICDQKGNHFKFYKICVVFWQTRQENGSQAS